jgi:acyl-CoA thioesterase-2
VTEPIEQKFETFAELMHLEPHGPDVYLGDSWRYPWGRVYGGQVVAQALKAAVQTVDPDHRPHSLHAYFIRGGSSDEPIRFEVDRIRDGRSFSTRRVVARQSSGAILNLSASFHTDEGDMDVATHMLPPNIPGPDELTDESWTTLFQRRSVPADAVDGKTAIWLRMREPIGDGAAAHEIATTYASDDVPYEATASLRPDYQASYEDEEDQMFVGASLDHAMWFHRPASADDWQLHILGADGYTGNRGLASGQIFGIDGTHLATVAQETVLRRNTKT